MDTALELITARQNELGGKLLEIAAHMWSEEGAPEWAKNFVAEMYILEGARSELEYMENESQALHSVSA